MHAAVAMDDWLRLTNDRRWLSESLIDSSSVDHNHTAKIFLGIKFCGSMDHFSLALCRDSLWGDTRRHLFFFQKGKKRELSRAQG